LPRNSPSPTNPRQRGPWAEAQVIHHFHSFKLLGQDIRTPLAEVDLIFQKETGGILAVEVKTLANFDFLPYRIKWRQKQRLFRACEYLREKYQQDVELNWAFVTEDGEILVIEDVSS
jgi:Holliday junction resolvase-like predicted endonuclease